MYYVKWCRLGAIHNVNRSYRQNISQKEQVPEIWFELKDSGISQKKKISNTQQKRWTKHENKTNEIHIMFPRS